MFPLILIMFIADSFINVEKVPWKKYKNFHEIGWYGCKKSPEGDADFRSEGIFQKNWTGENLESKKGFSRVLAFLGEQIFEIIFFRCIFLFSCWREISIKLRIFCHPYWPKKYFSLWEVTFCIFGHKHTKSAIQRLKRA